MTLLSPPPFFILFFTLSISSINGGSTISPTSFLTRNQSLSGRQTLVSPGGKFALGFFLPGNSSSYYLGIWFNNIPQSPLTSVWVANRESPLPDATSAKLKFSGDGNLVLLESSKTPIWSTKLTTTFSSSDSITAMLRHDGNFVLVKHYNTSSSTVVWQSFDHLGNTWLPGCMVGRDKITGQIRRLTSWKNNDDPSPGIFSLQVDRQVELRWNSSVVYWSTGPWKDGSFTNMKEMSSFSKFTFTYVSNRNGTYFTYNLKPGYSFPVRALLDIDGHIKVVIWVPEERIWLMGLSRPTSQCHVFGLCGPFSSCSEQTRSFCSCLKGFSVASTKTWELGDTTVGCRRKIGLECNRTSSTDQFFEMNDVKLPENSQTSSAASKSECEKACLKNCSCTAYLFNNRCLLWHGNLWNMQQFYDGSGEVLHLRLAAAELQTSRTKSKTLFVLIATGATIVSVAIISVLIWRRNQTGGLVKATGDSLVVYSYNDLKRATKNFSDKLGGGGFGSVFRGVLQSPNSNDAVAVKKLEGVHQGEKQFRAEVSTIGTIQHVNLVRLRGFCSEGAQRLLVYDFMANGSLAYQLFQNEENVLDWKTRYQIALGTARGLAYLHEECRVCIIHCDIKPENILLDSYFNPKVADFGLAKLVGRDFSRVLTTIRGTIGYLAPEWISKADVYSYGLMLFEIVAGKRNWGSEVESMYFPIYAIRKVREGGEGEILSLLDERLGGEGEVEKIARVCRVACWCIQDDESVRPTMGQIVQILEGVLEVEDDIPVPRTLILHAENYRSSKSDQNLSAKYSSMLSSLTS